MEGPMASNVLGTELVINGLPQILTTAVLRLKGGRSWFDAGTLELGTAISIAMMGVARDGGSG